MIDDPVKGLRSDRLAHQNRDRCFMGYGNMMHRKSRSAPLASLLCGLSEYWPLCETSGNCYGRHKGYTLGTVVGQPGATSGVVVGTPGTMAANFIRATPPTMNMASIADLQTSLTLGVSVSCWVYFTTWPPASVGYIFVAKDDASSQREWSLFTAAGSTTRFTIGNLSAFSTCGWTWAPTTGVWYHLVGTFDVGTNKQNIYLNGSLIAGPTTCTITPANGTSPFYIGIDGRGAGAALDGRMQRVGVWRRALTTDEITYLYNNGMGVDYPFT